MISLIDADSIIWIIAYNYRDPVCIKEEVEEAAMKYVRDILIITGATHYHGIFSDSPNFRHDQYRYAPYKGKRPEKPEWVVLWEPVIRECLNKVGFETLSKLEADDVVCFLAEKYREAGEQHIICSPDKDLKQIPGDHYDYRASNPKGDTEVSSTTARVYIKPEEARDRFWMQMLTGDDTDNIAGVPGLGPVKATTLLKPCKEEPMTYRSTVLGAYRRYFGEYYGPIIFEETRMAIMLLCKAHPIMQHTGPWQVLTIGAPISTNEYFGNKNSLFED